MKKRLAVVLSAIMALTMFGGQFAFAASGDQFTDVPSDAWYKPDVDYVAENDYMIGTSDTTFEPQNNLTRAMFATILARYDGAAVDNSVPTIFTDVEVNQWFTGSIGWANEKKIVEGRGDNIFDPTSFITRQELAVMVERYITYVESTTDKVHVTPGVAIPFTDADQISDWAQEAMDKAVIHGLIIGYPDKSVKPLQNITRAETAAVIHRIKWKTRDGKENFKVTILDEKGNPLDPIDWPVGQKLYPLQKDGGLFDPVTAPYGVWLIRPDGTKTALHEGDSFMLDGEGYALQPIVDYKVTLIDSVNDKQLGEDLVKPEESYTVPAGPEKSGYTFKEWNTEKDGKGTTYNPADTIDLTDNLTLFAIYTRKSSGGGGSLTPTPQPIVLPVDTNGNETPDVNIPVAADPENSDQYILPTYEEVVAASGGTIDPNSIKGYKDPKTGKVYKPGAITKEELDEIIENGGLTLVFDEYYTVTVNLTAAGEGPFTLTARYTEEEAAAKTVGDVAENLVSNYTDSLGTVWNNETKLENLMLAAITSKAANKGPKQFGNYVVTTTKDGVIHVDGINLAEKLQAEDDLFTQQMGEIRTLAKLNTVSDSVWDAYVKAFCLSNLYEPQANGDLKLLTKEEYVKVFKDAVKAITNLQEAIGDKDAYLAFLKAYEDAIGTSPLDVAFGTFGGSYQLLDTAFASPKELASVNEDIASVFANGNNDVLLDLVGEKDFNEACTVFSAKENITSADDVVNILKDRISRDWSGRDDIQSVLNALQEAYKGVLSVEVTVAKTA